jgi:CHAT domain-containing protein
MLRGMDRRRSSLTILFLGLALGLAACQPRAVSLDEAKKITAEFQGEGFVPPPRTIADISAILDQERPDPEAAARAREAADAQPAPGLSDHDLASFYMRRAIAAGDVGRAKQRLDDAREAARLAGTGHSKLSRIMSLLALAESRAGNVVAAIAAREAQAKSVQAGSDGQRFEAYGQMAILNARLGDIAGAQRWIATAESYLQMMSSRKSFQMYGDVWAQSIAEAKGAVARMEGRLADAETSYRAAIAGMSLAIKKSSSWSEPPAPGALETRADIVAAGLAGVLAEAGRSVEAEVEMRRALLNQLGRRGRDSTESATAALGLAAIIHQQGRYAEAEQLAQAALKMSIASGNEESSWALAEARTRIARAQLAQAHWDEAVATYDATRRGLAGDAEGEKRYLSGDLGYASALMRTGQAAAALPNIETVLAAHTARLGERHPDTVLARGFLAAALAATGQTEKALAAFAATLPSFLTRSRQNDDQQGAGDRALGVKVVLEAAMGFLADHPALARRASDGADPAGETFRLADAARGRNVQRAIAAAGARMASSDPILADLVRRDQDTEKQIASRLTVLADALSLPSDQQDANAIVALRRELDTLRPVRATLREEIEKRFPDYADLATPRPVKIDQVRQALHADEALVAFYVGPQRSFVWAVPKQGPVVFAAVPLGGEAMASRIGELRRSLNPNATALGDIPAFDTMLANQLYAALLQPVEAGWKGAKNLIVVPHGAIAQLPLGLLVTRPTERPVERAGQALFAGYKTVPFLARETTVTQLPSVATLAALRALPAGSPTRRAFAGFGDPWFNAAEAAEGRAGAVQLASADFAVRGGLHMRAAPATDRLASAELAMLPRLAETAEEVREVATALHADPVSDVFLGAAANEKQVRSMRLDDRRVIMFATHGLVPGDLNGLTQPALALSSPAVAGTDGNGLLTMEKIFGLKLDADWVVLSACNTASGDGAGAEAISGLGRAFFYAGARALLVTNWPVETNSARLLTTDTFRRQAADPSLTRAEAVRQAMLGLIDGPGAVDGAGRIAFSYAHPIFWAPFSLVGDGG